MSASMNWSPWKSAIGRPNCRRSPAYATAASSAACASADGAGGDAEPSRVERGQCDGEALALLADPALRGDPGTVEEDLRGRRGAGGPSCARAPRPRALAWPPGEQAARCRGRPASAGAHHEVVEVRHAAVRDPRLRAGRRRTSSPSRTARVDSDAASDPESGSDRQYAPSRRAVEHVRQPARLLLRGCRTSPAGSTPGCARSSRCRPRASPRRAPRGPADRSRTAARRRRARAG